VIESRRPADGTAEESAFPSPGRLNDPAALEPVYQDILQADGGLWVVSNAADFPGSGSLPYLYGALSPVSWKSIMEAKASPVCGAWLQGRYF